MLVGDTGFMSLVWCHTVTLFILLVWYGAVLHALCGWFGMEQYYTLYVVGLVWSSITCFMWLV